VIDHAVDRAHAALLRAFRRVPPRLRLAAIHLGSPGYTVGAIAIVTRDDGARLFVRHSYRSRWGAPGGLAKAGEDVRDAVRREAREEVGLEIELIGEPAVVVEPYWRRVDIVFAARPAPGVDPDSARPRPPEVVACEWFGVGSLPELQNETASALVALARARQGPDVEHV
jgi:ADP-ribose pyrophosphatase YjhB (NUDIX family)